jgi:hypothetical protein
MTRALVVLGTYAILGTIVVFTVHTLRTRAEPAAAST